MTTCENHLYTYVSLNTIVHFADPQVMDLEFMTFIVLFEREPFIIAGMVRYSSTTSIPPENMRLICMPLIEKVVYNSLCLQATNHCPETSIGEFRKNFVCPHQRQFIRENPNSTFPLITEIFGEITLNFRGLSQITALSKLPQITQS